MVFGRVKTRMIETNEALPGRSQPVLLAPKNHTVLGTPIAGPVPDGFAEIYFGLGCFWGAERKFWQVPGVYTTAVGYEGGYTPNPTYDEVCTGRTAHTEAVRVVYDPAKVSLEDLLKVFWTIHDPTQGYRQANDVGTQYRSAVYWTTPEQRDVILRDEGDVPGGDRRCRLRRHHHGRRAASRSTRSTTPRTTTSSTCTRTRTATTATRAPGSPTRRPDSPARRKSAARCRIRLPPFVE